MGQGVSRCRSVSLDQQSISSISSLDSSDHPETKQLQSAIQSCDVEAVKKLLKNSSEIECQNLRNSDPSALHIAVEVIATIGFQSIFEERDRTMRQNFENFLKRLKRPRELGRIVEVFLESGRCHVNALTDSSDTTLHRACDSCGCESVSHRNDYMHVANSIIKILLKNNANINAKTSSGETPLMIASKRGCSHIVKLLLKCRDEHGVGVDLNARDVFRETALIKAAKEARADVVELLLKHGCLDKFQDNQGFYALNAVICGENFSKECARSDFLALIGTLAAEEAHINLDPDAAHSSFGEAMRIDWTENDSIQKIVSLLMTHGQAQINAKDFRGNTVLDLALKSKHRINQKTVEMLKEYGASSDQPAYSGTTFEYTDRLGKTPLHRMFVVIPNPYMTLRQQFDYFRQCLNSSPNKEAFEEISVAKDIRGRTTLHYTSIPSTRKALKSEDILRMADVLKWERNINERDNYGRTPLHYCEREKAYKSLVHQGANEYIQDIDGKTPRDLKQLRDEEQNKYNLHRNLEDKDKFKKVDAWIIWQGSEFAYRDQFSIKMSDKVRQFVSRLSDEIMKKDSRFECRPVLIGSAEEGTKTELPDEFDFNLILTKLSELCEVVPSPEVPCGFVHLKRRSYIAEYQDLFDSDGFLLTSEIACRFRILYLQILSDPEIWQSDDIFEWDPYSEVGMKYDKTYRHFDLSKVSKDLDPSDHPCSTIQLILNRPIDGRYMFSPISLDIVPCIKINGWWPENTLSSVSDQIKCEGCHLVFDQPQRHYPWVPFSDPFARISFAPAESRLIKECSAVARAAYMVGKYLLLYYDKTEMTYVLKTCLLYCIEALKDCTNSSLHYEDIHPTELRYFVEKLMLCFHQFYLQDFFPCYIMSSFHLPIKGYLKSMHDSLLKNPKLGDPLFACQLHKCVCTTESEVDVCIPTPQPMGENFYREELLRTLSVDRS